MAYVDDALGYPPEERSVTEHFGDGFSRLWLSTGAPISGLSIDTYNSASRAYDAIDSQHIRTQGDNRVLVTLSLPHGFQSLRATHTTGWVVATLSADPRRVLIGLVGLKLQEVTNYSKSPDDPNGNGSAATTGAIKRVPAWRAQSVVRMDPDMPQEFVYPATA